MLLKGKAEKPKQFGIDSVKTDFKYGQIRQTELFDVLPPPLPSPAFPPYFGRKRLAWVRELLTFETENALDLIELFYVPLFRFCFE